MKQKITFLLLLLSLAVGTALGQSIQIKGRVVDENNDPTPGVNIRLKTNPTKGTSTKLDGTFSLQARKGEILVVSYIGYATQELAAEANMQIRLKPDAKALDEVVLIGYMPRKITNTSASVVKVDAKALSAKPVANPFDALQGKMSGLQIFSSSGEPSATLSMALHGRGSLGAGTGMLFIMDGMPINQNIVRAMNPNDIESVQLLKDAAATSIYGARAANGVVYITTKRGRNEERATVTLRSQYAVSSLANTDYFDQLMTASELLRYYEETGLYSKSELEHLNETTFKGTDFQWYKYIYQPAPMYSADVSVSGGTQKTNYYLSGGLLNQKGLRLGSGYQKVFGRLNLNATLNPKIRAGLNTMVAYDDRRESPFGNQNASGGGLAALNPPFVSPYDPETGEELDYIPLLKLTTPKHFIPTHPSRGSSFIFSSSGNLTITPIKALTIRSMVGVETNYNSGGSGVLPSFRNAYGNGSASRRYASVLNFSTNNTISYLLNLRGGHNITALAGHEYINFTSEDFSAGGSGILDDRLTLLGNVSKDHWMNEGDLSYAFLSFFTQLSYDFKERYFVDLVLRNDASSRFGRNTRNGLFGSVGLLWKAKKEDFLRSVKWLNTLDLKLSYGTQGNSAIPPYAISSYAGRVGLKEGNMSLGFASLGNPNLSWERQAKFTIGAKARLWNKLEVNLEYYRRLTKDMLFEVPQSLSSGLSVGSLGFVTQYENVGRYLNSGIDLQLNLDVLRAKDYGLSLYANFNYNRDKVLALFDGRKDWFEPGSQFGYIVGEPVTHILPLYKGVNPQTGRPEWYQPGEYIGKAQRDDSKVVDEWSIQLEQNTGIPINIPMTGGFGLEARWKDFYLNADFAFSLGKYILSQDKRFYENDYFIRNKEGNYNGSRLLLDYWKKPGDVTEFPSLDYVRDNRSSQYIDSKMLENASFMRMKNLTIGYNLPKHLLGKQRVLTGAKVYFAGRNLLTVTKFRGIDPEVNSSSSFGANPNTKQFSIGAELTF